MGFASVSKPVPVAAQLSNDIKASEDATKVKRFCSADDDTRANRNVSKYPRRCDRFPLTICAHPARPQNPLQEVTDKFVAGGPAL